MLEFLTNAKSQAKVLVLPIIAILFVAIIVYIIFISFR